VKLDLVSRLKRAGREQVSAYFTNYDQRSDWHLVPGWLDGREVVAVFRDPRNARPDYFMELTLVDGDVAAIRDYRYVPYTAREAAIELASAPQGTSLRNSARA
jgi:RNA polymerase sigma-70 factor (ECF subfamily)